MATSSDHPRRRPAPDPIKALWQSWFRRKGPVLRVAAKLSGLMALYHLLSFLPVSERALDAWVADNARLASHLLNFVGEKSHIIENTICGGQFAVTVLKACAGLDYACCYCAALIAFPAPLGRKIPGILGGVAILLAMNLTRIMSLFLVGVHFPRALATVHEQVWPVLSVVATMCLTVAWIERAQRRDDATSNAT